MAPALGLNAARPTVMWLVKNFKKLIAMLCSVYANLVTEMIFPAKKLNFYAHNFILTGFKNSAFSHMQKKKQLKTEHIDHEEIIF